MYTILLGCSQCLQIHNKLGALVFDYYTKNQRFFKLLASLAILSNDTFYRDFCTL